MLSNRPKSDETEEDILRLQEEFIRGSSAAPCVSIKKSSVPPSVAKQDAFEVPKKEIKLKKSLFASRMAERPKEQASIPSVPIVVKDVVEKVVVAQPRELKVVQSGFPSVFHRTKDSKFLKKAKERSEAEARLEEMDKKQFEGDLNEIHRKNLEKIKGMSAEEMEEMQREIFEKLDPAVIEKLRNRANRKYGAISKDASPVNETSSEGKQVTFVPEVAEIVKVWTPPSEIEYEKLEWMASTKGKKQGSLEGEEGDVAEFLTEDLNKIRFDLGGKEVLDDTGISALAGLHHHGEDPEKAGYTITELVQLSRSSATQQRIIAVSTLSRIIQTLKSNENIQEKSQKLVKYFLDKYSVLLSFRVALDDPHLTVVSAGLKAMLSYFETYVFDGKESKSQEDLMDIAFQGSLGHRSFALARQSIIAYMCQATNCKVPEEEVPAKEIGEYSIDEIRNILDIDQVKGLCATNILLRLSVLLGLNGLSHEMEKDILLLLVRFARHSSFVAAEIAKIPRLINWILDHVALSIPLPSCNESTEKLETVSSCVKLVRVIAMHSKENCATIKECGVLDIVLRFLTLPLSAHSPSQRKPIAMVQTEIFRFLEAFALFGLEGRVFDEFRSLLLQSLEESLAAMALESRNSLINAQLKYLTAISLSFPHQVQIGTFNDAMRPFVMVLMDALSKPHVTSFGVTVWIAGLDLLAVYVELFDKSSDLLPGFVQVLLASPVFRLDHPLMARSLERSIASHPGCKAPREYNYGFFMTKELENAFTVVEFSLETETWASFLSLLVKCSQLHPQLKLVMARVMTNLQTECMLNCATEKPQSMVRSSLARLFMPGPNSLRLKWLECIGAFSESNRVIEKPAMVQIYRVAHQLLLDLLPGDEQSVSLLLDKILLNPLYLEKVLCLQKRDDATWSHISQLFRMNLINEQLLLSSSCFHGEICNRQDLFSLSINFEEIKSHLPVPLDWLFIPILVILDEAVIFPGVSGLRSVATGSSEAEISNGKVVESCLGFIDASFEAQVLTGFHSAPRVLVNLMRVFLLPALKVPVHQEIFEFGNISAIIDRLLDRLITGDLFTCGDGAHPLERSCGGQAKFYSLYKELVAQYAAISWGNKTFGRLLVLPLSTCFAKDYRLLFWTELFEYLKSFTLSIDEVISSEKGSDHLFLPVPETSDEVVRFYLEAIEKGLITKEKNALLFSIANDGIASFPKEQASEGLWARVERYLGSKSQ